MGYFMIISHKVHFSLLKQEKCSQKDPDQKLVELSPRKLWTQTSEDSQNRKLCVCMCLCVCVLEHTQLLKTNINAACKIQGKQVFMIYRLGRLCKLETSDCHWKNVQPKQIHSFIKRMKFGQHTLKQFYGSPVVSNYISARRKIQGYNNSLYLV